MGLQVVDRTVESIYIVDDEASVRDSYEETVRDLGLRPIQEKGPLGPLEVFATRAMERSQAALCDFKLRVRTYATFDGAQLAAHWYDLSYPVLLCTKWDKASIDELRRYRARIPVLIKPSELDPDRITAGLELCVNEFAGTRVASRRVWRTIVRVEEVAEGPNADVHVVVPGWEPNEVIRLSLADIPADLRAAVVPEARLYARVNLGAETYEDLFFGEWERP